MNAASVDGLNTSDNPVGSYGREVSISTRQRISAHSKGRRHTPESIARISAAKKGHRPTLEQRQRQAAAQVGLKRSDETRQRMSDASKGKTKSLEHRKNISIGRFGKKQSKETIERKRKALLGRIFKPESIIKQKESLKRTIEFRKANGIPVRLVHKWVVVTDNLGSVVFVTSDAHEAAEHFGISYGSVRLYLLQGNPVRGGFTFHRAEAIIEPREQSSNTLALACSPAPLDHPRQPPETEERRFADKALSPLPFVRE